MAESLSMRRCVLISALLLAAACVPKSGRLEANRYQSDEYPYAVFYTEGGGALAPLGAPWQLANYVRNQDRHQFLPKNEPEFMVDRDFDTNGDGIVDQNQRVPLYDLLLQHGGKDAQLWVRTVPMQAKDKAEDLSALARRYVEDAASTGSVVARFGEEVPAAKLTAPAATKTLLDRFCSVSKREAYRVDFEIETKAEHGSQLKRGSVVLVRTGYQHQLTLGKGKAFEYPVLMLIGMTSLPQDFDQLEPDFERLLKQTVLGDQFQGLSMNGEHTCGLTAPHSSGGEQEHAVPTAP